MTMSRNAGTYVGEHRDGRRHGQGTFTFAYGDRYVGEYQNNQPHGLGTYTFNTGERYLGEFRNGIKEGQGSWFTPDGRLQVNGIWRNDAYVYANNAPNPISGVKEPPTRSLR